MPFLPRKQSREMPESTESAEKAIDTDDVRLPTPPKICKNDGFCLHYNGCKCREEIERTTQFSSLNDD